jgi:8-oxo-dGTP pyrophosphatase MutT (NUDIX family)
VKRELEALDLGGGADGPGQQNLSPGVERSGRACGCVLHKGLVLVVAVKGGRWSLPGGGIEPGETAAGAAAREVWEECGAHVVIEGTGFAVTSPHDGVTSQIFLARLLRQEASPEGREHAWVDPTQSPWCDDYQLAPALTVMRERGWL